MCKLVLMLKILHYDDIYYFVIVLKRRKIFLTYLCESIIYSIIKYIYIVTIEFSQKKADISEIKLNKVYHCRIYIYLYRNKYIYIEINI